MGEQITLKSPIDGLKFAAYHAPAQEARRGGLVVLHAIWGVTPHIRELCDSFAEDGYEVIAPNLSERLEPGFVPNNVDPAHMAERNAWADSVGWGEACLPDVQAAIDALEGPVFCLGFCFGGTAAWLAACRLTGLSAVASYYGGQIYLYRDETPKVPTILHLGRKDELIPPEEIERMRAAHPDLPIYVYDAGHAFVAPNGYHEDSARLSRLRTLALFSRNSGGRAEA